MNIATHIYDGRASGLTYAHLGAMVQLKDQFGTPYEGALTYVSFDATRGENEKVAVALASTDNPVDDVVFYLAADHRVLVHLGVDDG